MKNHKKYLEIKLTDDGDQTNMTAEINVGRNTTPEMLDDMINAFDNLREGLYNQAREQVKIYDQAKKDEADRRMKSDYIDRKEAENV